MFGVAENINYLSSSIKKWTMIFRTGNLEFSEVDIRRDIFQGDSLFTFVLELVPLSQILRKAKVAIELSESKEKTK